MKYDVIQARELTPQLISRWREIQNANSTLANPYFYPEFTVAVASLRKDVSVGIIQDHKKIVGFFPFHHSRGVGRPIGLGLSDYHGIIIKQGLQFDPRELLKRCGLVRWEFDHLLASQNQFSDFHKEVSMSPIISVSQGYKGFESSLNSSGRKQLREAHRKLNKLEDQVGPVSFIPHTQDQNILNQLQNWKSKQCNQTGTIDFFSIEWCRKLIQHIHQTRTMDFGGILSCLYAGDTLAAVHFAMYSKTVWHSWFPAYNNKLLKYSPGTILLFKMIQEASENNIDYIDLGKGMSLYKKRVMTDSILVADGDITVPTIKNTIRHLFNNAETWGEKSRFKPVLRIPGKIIKTIQQKNKYN